MAPHHPNTTSDHEGARPAAVPRRIDATAEVVTVSKPRVVLHLPDLRSPTPVAVAPTAGSTSPPTPRGQKPEPKPDAPKHYRVDAAEAQSIAPEPAFWKRSASACSATVRKHPAILLVALIFVAVQLLTLAAFLRPVTKPSGPDSETMSHKESHPDAPPPNPALQPAPRTVPDTATRTAPVEASPAPAILSPGDDVSPQWGSPDKQQRESPLDDLSFPAWDDSAGRGMSTPQYRTAAMPGSVTDRAPPTARLRGTIDRPVAPLSPSGR